jgi:hypothetical protein
MTATVWTAESAPARVNELVRTSFLQVGGP